MANSFVLSLNMWTNTGTMHGGGMSGLTLSTTWVRVAGRGTRRSLYRSGRWLGTSLVPGTCEDSTGATTVSRLTPQKLLWCVSIRAQFESRKGL